MAFWSFSNGTTRWATLRDLRKGHALATEGLILGSYQGHLVQHNGPEHALVIASTQSGKTSSFVCPNLLTWHQSCIVHDPKNELARDTLAWRKTFSRVVRLAPAESVSDQYNVFDAIQLRTDQATREIQLIAESITDPEGAGVDHTSNSSKHFRDMATEALQGLIPYGLLSHRASSLGGLNHLVRTMEWGDLIRTMVTYPDRLVRETGVILQRISGPELSGVQTTLSRALRVYSDPLIQRATDRSSFALRDLRERACPMTVYLAIPFGDQERLRPWSRLVLRQLLNACLVPRAGKWDVLGMIDEVPGLHKLTMLTEGLNYFAGFGVRLALITPSMEELIKTYGQHHNFLEGCKLQMVFGMHDPRVAELFSQRVGQTEVTKTRWVGKQRVTEKVKEPLLSATALMSLPDDQALVVLGRHKVLVRRAYYKDNAIWKQRSEL